MAKAALIRTRTSGLVSHLEPEGADVDTTRAPNPYSTTTVARMPRLAWPGTLQYAS